MTREENDIRSANGQQPDLGTGDVFGYNLNDQVTAVRLNIANPDTAAPGAPTILYDANGNRTSLHHTGKWSYRFATRGSRFARGAGRVFFGAQVVTSGIDLYNDPSLANWQRQGTTLGVGLIGFAGIPGFVFATTYFILDETDTWDFLEHPPLILVGPF